MIDKLDYSKCVLCKACSNICPNKCITFEEEHDTFLYPKIDYKECVECNLCEKVCPVSSKKETFESEKNVSIVKSKNEETRKESSSGGFFFEVGKDVLNQSGIVYGVKITENFDITFDNAGDEKKLEQFRKSKYVQADMKNTYIDIKEKLNKGREVLFSGCPCQVAALKKYLRKDYDNLICVDFICHGVPSENIFKGYISMLEKKYKSKIKEISFRNKRKGWSNSSISVKFENGNEYSEEWIYDAYMIGFLKNVFLKKSCYKCEFKNLKSRSDITIGDFWGAEVFLPQIDDDKGLSVIIRNTLKGEKIFKKVSDSLNIYDIDFKSATKYNQHLFNSAVYNENRESFFDDVKKIGIENSIKKYCEMSKYKVLKGKIRRKLGKIKKYIKVITNINGGMKLDERKSS